MLRVVFMGTPELAAAVLRRLVRSPSLDVVLVVTQPDRPQGRRRQLAPPPVKQVAAELGLPIIQPVRLRRPEGVARVAAARPDLFAVVAYGEILSPELLALPRLAPVNLHASLLPAYRGAAPIAWAILAGEEVTGMTTMWIDAGMDSGDILEQTSTPVRAGETAGELEARLTPLGAELLVHTLETFSVLGTKVPRRAQDPDGISYAPKLRKEYGWLDWAKPVDRLAREVRAYNPWPGSYTRYVEAGAARQLKVHRARALQPAAADALPPVPRLPGEVVRADAGGLWVGAGGQRLLALEEVQPEGRRAMTAAEFLRGHAIAVGSLLGEAGLSTGRG